MCSDKHSTFSTTFPIYILERHTKDIPVAPQTPKGDADPDEFDDDLESDDQSDADVKTRHGWVSEWVRVNDKAPIWMRWVVLSCRKRIEADGKGPSRRPRPRVQRLLQGR